MRIGLLADIHEEVGQLDRAIEALQRRGGRPLRGPRRRLRDRQAARADRRAARRARVRGGLGQPRLRPLPRGRRGGPPPVRPGGPPLFRILSAPGSSRTGCWFQHIEPYLDSERLEDLWSYAGEGLLDSPRSFARRPHRRLFMGHVHRWALVGPDGPEPWAAPADPARPGPPLPRGDPRRSSRATAPGTTPRQTGSCRSASPEGGCPAPDPEPQGGFRPMTDDFATLFAYDRWANRLVLDACRGLSPEQYAAEPRRGGPRSGPPWPTSRSSPRGGSAASRASTSRRSRPRPTCPRSTTRRGCLITPTRSSTRSCPASPPRRWPPRGPSAAVPGRDPPPLGRPPPSGQSRDLPPRPDRLQARPARRHPPATDLVFWAFEHRPAGTPYPDSSAVLPTRTTIRVRMATARGHG